MRVGPTDKRTNGWIMPPIELIFATKNFSNATSNVRFSVLPSFAIYGLVFVVYKFDLTFGFPK